jgi:hypothetical protein
MNRDVVNTEGGGGTPVGTVGRERQSAGRAETAEECRRSRSEGAESRPGSLVFVFVFVFFVFLGTSGQ